MSLCVKILFILFCGWLFLVAAQCVCNSPLLCICVFVIPLLHVVVLSLLSCSYIYMLNYSSENVCVCVCARDLDIMPYYPRDNTCTHIKLAKRIDAKKCQINILVSNSCVYSYMHTIRSNKLTSQRASQLVNWTKPKTKLFTSMYKHRVSIDKAGPWLLLLFFLHENRERKRIKSPSLLTHEDENANTHTHTAWLTATSSSWRGSRTKWRNKTKATTHRENNNDNNAKPKNRNQLIKEGKTTKRSVDFRGDLFFSEIAIFLSDKP